MAFGLGFSLPAYLGYGGGFGAGATLVLDFTSGNQTLDPRITFTRASTATRTNSSGVLVSEAINGPRFDYDPVTLAPRGLLIEEQRSNLLLLSSDLFDSGGVSGSWIYAAGTIQSNTTSAPDGTVTADTLTTTGAIQSIYQSATVTASTAYTFSVYVRLGTMLASDYKIAVYNNTAASFIASDVVPTQTPTTTGWTRITYTFTTPVGCTSVRVYPFRNGAGLSSCTVILWGAQLEAGAFATSYIPTTTAAATRAADVATMTGANFSNWYNQTEGTLFVDGVAVSSTTQTSTLASIEDGTTSERIQIRRTTSLAAGSVMVDGGVVQASIADANNSWVDSSARKIALAFSLNDVAFATQGALIGADTSATLPTPNQMLIGNGSGVSYANGHIRKIAYYPRRLANSELQALTS